MYYCSYCDGENEKTAEYCVYCGSEILAKEDYERKADFIMSDVEQSKIASVLTVAVFTIMGACCAMAYITDVYPGSVAFYGIVILVEILIITIFNSIFTHQAKNKERTRLAQIAYLYLSGTASSKSIVVSSMDDTRKDTTPDTETSRTGAGSKLKGEIKKSASISMASKQKEAYNIYMYTPYHMADYWVCECCDTENTVTKEKCIVCGMLK